MTAYHFTGYKKSLEEAIQSDTSGHFCRILVSLVQVMFITMRTQTVFNFHTHSLVAEKKKKGHCNHLPSFLSQLLMKKETILSDLLITYDILI